MRHRMTWPHAVWLIALVAGCTKSATAPPPALLSTTDPPPRPSEVAKLRTEKPREEPKRPPLPSTCVWFGECYARNMDKAEPGSAQRQQAYEQARRAYEQALQLDPRCQPALVGLARLHERQQEYPQAIARYKDALALEPQSAGVWYQFGMCWARQGHWANAIECLRRASVLEPRNTSYANQYGFALARAGQFDASYAHFCRTVGEARANYNLALMARHMGRHELSREYLTRALQIDPNFEEAKQLLTKAGGSLPPSPAAPRVLTAPAEPPAAPPVIQQAHYEPPAPEPVELPAPEPTPPETAPDHRLFDFQPPSPLRVPAVSPYG